MFSNAVAVACVVAAMSLKGFWVADPIGAACISAWIMLSWWDVGKVTKAQGRVQVFGSAGAALARLSLDAP